MPVSLKYHLDKVGKKRQYKRIRHYMSDLT